MNDPSKDDLNEQLQAMLAGRGDGIDLDTPLNWVIEGLENPISFFEHLPKLLPPNSNLYIEGTGIAPELTAFYSKNIARDAVDVVRDTIAPVPDMHHIPFSSAVCAALQKFAMTREVPEMFDHLKAYCGGNLLFTFHDAFDGQLLVSQHVDEAVVAQFCEVLGVTYRREVTKRRDPEQLRRFMMALENPHLFRIAGERWWQRLPRKLKKWLRRLGSNQRPSD